MTPRQIGQAYDSLTHLWESPDFNLTNGMAQHHQAYAFLDNANRQFPSRALDIGCGCTNRVIDWLASQFDCVEGLDVSLNMLTLAQQKRPDIAFHHADFLTWATPHQYDFISCWDAFWHIPLEQQSQALLKMLSLLAPHGVCIFSFGGVDAPDRHTNSYMGVEMAYSSLGLDGYVSAVQQAGCIQQWLEFDQQGEKHCFMIAQKSCVPK